MRSILLSSFQMKKKLTVDYEHNIKPCKYLHAGIYSHLWMIPHLAQLTIILLLRLAISYTL